MFSEANLHGRMFSSAMVCGVPGNGQAGDIAARPRSTDAP